MKLEEGAACPGLCWRTSCLLGKQAAGSATEQQMISSNSAVAIRSGSASVSLIGRVAAVRRLQAVATE